MSNPFFMSAIIYDIIRSDHQLEEILNLQRINLPQHISDEEKQSQGFVTIEHDFKLLKQMNEAYPHVIAMDEGKVIGYTLVMLRKFKDRIDILIPMFNKIDEILNDQGQTKSYFVMGQVCVAKPYRGKGVFKGLYDKMKEVLSKDFDCCITEVDPSNLRSLKAHHNQGFERLSLYEDDKNRFWELIIWDWK